MKTYVADFGKQVSASDEAQKKLRDSMQTWLEVFKFPTVERTTYDRAECTAKNQIYPLLGDMIVAEITAKEIRHFLNTLMNDGYAYTTVKKAYVLLGEYFRYLTHEKSSVHRLLLLLIVKAISKDAAP